MAVGRVALLSLLYLTLLPAWVDGFFLYFLSPSSFIPPQNAVYFLVLSFLVHKIFTFYVNGVLNCKCSAAGPKG